MRSLIFSLALAIGAPKALATQHVLLEAGEDVSTMFEVIGVYSNPDDSNTVILEIHACQTIFKFVLTPSELNDETTQDGILKYIDETCEAKRSNPKRQKPRSSTK
jgi:hypothetical protein